MAKKPNKTTEKASSGVKWVRKKGAARTLKMSGSEEKTGSVRIKKTLTRKLADGGLFKASARRVSGRDPAEPAEIINLHEPPVRRRAPTPPGVQLLEGYMKPRKVSQRDLAVVIDRSEKFVSQLVTGKPNARIDRSLAMKLSKIFVTTPELWLNLQAATDAWLAEQELKEWAPGKVWGPDTVVDEE